MVTLVRSKAHWVLALLLSCFLAAGALRSNDVLAADSLSEEVMAALMIILGGGVDSDNDGVADEFDAFPNDPYETDDSDLDGVGDLADAFPDDPFETIDTDSDGVGDNADADDDGDGIDDLYDSTPLDFTDVTPLLAEFSEVLVRLSSKARAISDFHRPLRIGLGRQYEHGDLSLCFRAWRTYQF